MIESSKFSAPYWLLKSSRDQEQEFVVVIAATSSVQVDVEKVKQCLSDNDVVVHSTEILSKQFAELSIKLESQKAWILFKKLLINTTTEAFDVAVLPVSTRRKKLLICDMDSTIVKTEALDDIAEHIGIGTQVSDITARAMRGELDFRQALDERVSLMKDISENVFTEIADTVKFNLGAELLLKSVQEQGIRTVLVSGGFEPVVKEVAAKLGFDRYVCNKLEIASGKLTGNILAPLVDAETKLNILKEECTQLAISSEQVCAVGDGANDLPMLQAAGLGIAYRGKPLLRRTIPYQLNSSTLASVLLMLGIAK